MDSRLFSILVKSQEFQEALRLAVQAELEARDLNQNPEPVFYTEDEVLKILRISRPTCYKYRRLGILEASKVGRRLLFTAEQVNAAVQTIPTVKHRV